MRGYKRDTDVKNRLLDSVEDGEGRMIWEDRTETCISAYVKLVKVQVWCMRQGSQGWCTVTAWGMGWEGRCEGFQDGDTYTPMADSRECMAKITIIILK